MSSAPSWDAALYSRHTSHHRAYDDHILEPLTIGNDFQVLDIGSGAGDLTAKLAARVPAGSVTGIDSSPSLVDAARERLSGAANVEFRLLRAQDLGELRASEMPNGKPTGPPFDLVVSVATLHWVPGNDHPALYRAIFDVLGPEAKFRADFGGAGQILEVRTVLNETAMEFGGIENPWYFPDTEEVALRLTDAGFEVRDGFVRLVPQRRSVPDESAFVGWLDSQVLIAYRPGLPEGTYDAFRTRAIERLLQRGPRADGSFDQDYVRMDVLVTKPKA
jgi:trans-aconitate methyltransferase